MTPTTGRSRKYDFIGVVEHEISEVLGRFLLVAGTIGNMSNSYGPLDLFHYSSPGVRDFVGTQAGYFSINGGNTNLDNFNTNQNGDFGDWAVTAGNDAFLAFSNPGSASGTAVDSRGFDFIVSGVGDHTVLMGSEFVVSGGMADFTTIDSGGVQVVSANAYSATVNGGGVQLVASGGTASSTTVEYRGYEYVGSGGTASATTIDGGVEVANGGSTGSAPIAFTSSGGTFSSMHR